MHISSPQHKLRILHIIRYTPLDCRTLDHWLLLLASACLKKGWEYTFIFPSEPVPSFCAKLRAMGANFYVIESLEFASLPAYMRILASVRPDITLSAFHGVFNKYLAFLKAVGLIKILAVFDDHSIEGTPQGFKRWIKLKLYLLYRRSVDAYLPVSKYILDYNCKERRIKAAKSYLLYNGLQLENYPFTPRAQAEVIHIAYGGRLIPEKGVDTLFDACRKLKAARLPFHLSIAGAGEDEALLRAQAADLGDSVSFVGFCSNIAQFFTAADIVVVPSRYKEAFGLTAIEAMATGAAVIVSDRGGLPETVGEDGGLIFHGEDSDDLARKISQCAASLDLRQELGRRGRQRVEQWFDLNVRVEKMIDIIEKLSGNAR